MRFDITSSWRSFAVLLLCWLGKPIVSCPDGSSKQGEKNDIASTSNYTYTIRNNDPVVQEIKLGSLITEYLDSPLGVDKGIPRVSWRIQNTKEEDESTARHIRRNVFQQSYQLHVSSLTTSSVWKDCGWVTSKETSLVPLECEGVTPISTSDMNVSWRVSVQLNDGSVIKSDVAHFRTGMLDPWKAHWISGGHLNYDRTLFRKEFSLAKPNRTPAAAAAGTTDSHHATLFVAGLGYNHVYLNGMKVGDHQLDPGWTNYTKRVWYSTYDVTDMLRFDDREGMTSNDVAANNAIVVMLGNGWWSCGPLPGTKQDYCTNDPPQLILQLHVDGQPVLLSDDTWRTSALSPIVYNSLYNGEVYDARIAELIKGWKYLGYNDRDWLLAKLAKNEASKAILASQLFEPIRHVSTRSPVSIVVAGNDDNLTQVLDFGQNQAAVVRLKHIRCVSGTSVRLRHAELIMHPPYGEYDNATIYVENLRTAEATDCYICSGDPNGESYTPTFTQHGFRYVEVTGLNYTLDPSDVEAVEVHTDVKQTSFIEFVDPLLNQIQHMVMWGLKSNFMGVQTDCDQRDERKGWMGDAALTAEAAVLSYGMGAFYTQWLVSENRVHYFRQHCCCCFIG
jgi:alpha-L-rhamnosidase